MMVDACGHARNLMSQCLHPLGNDVVVLWLRLTWRKLLIEKIFISAILTIYESKW
jgi:hypothetical protein